MEGASHPHYAHYHRDQIRRLDGFFGRVDDDFNRRIAAHVVGPRVLDFGAGFGSLGDHLNRRGFDATGIDLLELHVAAGKDRFPGIDLRVVTPGPLPFDDDAFESVVFKESLHHLAAESDVDDALTDVARVCSRRMIIFEPNPSVPLKVARTLIGHVDPTLPVEEARALVEKVGFALTAVEYMSALALPLSGGYVGRPLVPARAPTRILRLDERIVGVLGRRATWRYILVADKTNDAS